MEEYFFSLTLTNDKNSEKILEDSGWHKLIIKHISLGPEVPKGEINIVQLEALTAQKYVKVPIAMLKAGGPNQQVSLNLSFEHPVTFSLVQGTGPVHILGYQIAIEAEDDAADEEDAADEDNAVEEEVTHLTEEELIIKNEMLCKEEYDEV